MSSSNADRLPLPGILSTPGVTLSADRAPADYREALEDVRGIPSPDHRMGWLGQGRGINLPTGEDEARTQACVRCSADNRRGAVPPASARQKEERGRDSVPRAHLPSLHGRPNAAATLLRKVRRSRRRSQRGLAALGRNQKTPLQALVVTIVTITGCGDGLEIFVKNLTIFEVSSIGLRTKR